MVPIICHDQTKFLIALGEIPVVEVGSLLLQFLEKSVGCALLVFQSAAPVIRPGIPELCIPTKNG